MSDSVKLTVGSIVCSGTGSAEGSLSGLPRYIAICDISRYFLYIAICDISRYFFGHIAIQTYMDVRR